jgi:rfaE bifunctional protein kinase chain/domain
MKQMTLQALETLLGRLSRLHIGVIGDFALDCYWMLDASASQPSVETGKPTQPVARQHYTAGAAGNVVANLAALGCGRVSAFGVVGRDPWGDELLHLLRQMRADTTGIAQQDRDWATVAYAKPHIGGVEQPRIDFGDFNRLHDSVADRLVDSLASALPGLDAVIINAQARSGIHTGHLRQRLETLTIRYPDRLFIVDSRDPLAIYNGCMLKINNLEAARYGGDAAPITGNVPRAQSIMAAAALFAEREKPVFITCGADGMVVHDHAGVTEIPAVPIGDTVDTTGAGDAALAGITAALAAGATPPEAAVTGTLAAAICAGKLHQTGTASPDEILALMRRQTA